MKHEVENVLAYGDQNQLAHWKIFIGTNIREQKVYASTETMLMPPTAITWEASRPVLETYLSIAPANTYTIHFRKNYDDKTATAQLPFRITEDAHAHIGNVQQPANQMSPQFMMQYMTSEIGRVTATLTADWEKRELQRKLDEMEAKYKKKEKSGIGFTMESFNEFVKNLPSAITAIKNLNPAHTTPISIGHSNTNVPADANAKAVAEEEKYLLTDQLQKLEGETIADLIEIFGTAENVVIEMHCFKEFIKVNKPLYDSFVTPQLAPFKKALHERGIIPGK